MFQRHTSKRIFQRPRDEHNFTGGYTIVMDVVPAWKLDHQEVFLPLSHPPGEAQVDFGEATITLQGVETKVALFVMTLPNLGTIFVPAFPRGMHGDVSGTVTTLPSAGTVPSSTALPSLAT